MKTKQLLTRVSFHNKEKAMVKAGLAIFLLNCTVKPTSVEEAVVTQVGDCDEVERYLRLPEIPLQTSSGHD
jgi:hypothetical protein